MRMSLMILFVSASTIFLTCTEYFLVNYLPVFEQDRIQDNWHFFGHTILTV